MNVIILTRFSTYLTDAQNLYIEGSVKHLVSKNEKVYLIKDSFFCCQAQYSSSSKRPPISTTSSSSFFSSFSGSASTTTSAAGPAPAAAAPPAALPALARSSPTFCPLRALAKRVGQ